MKINDIDFEIKNINIEKEHSDINYNRLVYSVPLSQNISINAFTKTDNYLKLDKWFNEHNSPRFTNKKDIIYNTVQIYGIFPIDYTFDQYGINVTFSADHITGDLSLFNKQKLRRE